jgi:isoleucyl-tRNA synthetase
MLCFTAEEAWLTRDPTAVSVHLEQFPEIPQAWRDDALAKRWHKVREARRVVTGAIEIARAAKTIGSSLEAHPIILTDDQEMFEALTTVDMAEACITSAATLEFVPRDQVYLNEAAQLAPRWKDIFHLQGVPSVYVEVRLAEGKKCARSWKISPAVGSDPQYPDVTPRDAQALREWDGTRKAAG